MSPWKSYKGFRVIGLAEKDSYNYLADADLENGLNFSELTKIIRARYIVKTVEPTKQVFKP